MPDGESSKARAIHNGIKFENYAKSHLKNFEFINGLFDAEYKGKPMDVKSCQEVQSDVHAANGWRYGRIIFRKEQHEAILKEDGYYFVVVHSGTKILKRRIIKAKDLNLPEFDEIFKMTWKKLFQAVGVAC